MLQFSFKIAQWGIGYFCEPFFVTPRLVLQRKETILPSASSSMFLKSNFDNVLDDFRIKVISNITCFKRFEMFCKNG